MTDTPKVTWIDLHFADGVYRFQLKMAQILALEEAAGKGIGRIYADVARGRYTGAGERVDQTIGLPTEAEFASPLIFETIRQGLLGGNRRVRDEVVSEVSPLAANILLDTYVKPYPLTDAWDVAFAVLHGCIQGYDAPEEPQEPPAAEAA